MKPCSQIDPAAVANLDTYTQGYGVACIISTSTSVGPSIVEVVVEV